MNLLAIEIRFYNIKRGNILAIIKNITWYQFSFWLAIAAIAAVYFLQYVMNIAPCDLCYKQRYIWYAIASISLVAHFYHNRLLFFIITLLFIASLGLALYHTGIIYGLWIGPTSCSNQSLNISNLQNTDFSSLSNLSYPALCSSADQKLFGIALPFNNAILSVFGLLTHIFLRDRK